MPDADTEVRRYIEATIDRVQPVTAAEARARATRTPPVTTSRRVLVLAAVVAAVLGAIGIVSAVNVARDTTTVTADAPLAAPLTLDGHVTWFLALYNGTHAPSDDEIASRFTDDFVREIPPPRVRETAANVAASGNGWAVLREVERRDNTLATQLVADNGEQARLSMMIDASGRVAFETILRADACPAPVDPGAVTLAGPLEQRLQWVLENMNFTTNLSDEHLALVFTPSYLRAIEPDYVRRVAADVRTDAPLAVRHFESEPTGQQLAARVGTDTGRETRIALTIEPTAPHRITGLSFKPNPTPCVLPVG